jgi:DNA-binding transcriptional LysR family regulator
MKVDLKHIRHALALARYRNFARAAEALHLTQPSLSRSIAALEESLGVKLFDRGKKSIEATAYGRVLLERGEELLGRAADLRRELRLMAGLEAGSLGVCAGPYATEISVGTAVTRLLSAHPRLKLEVLSANPDEIVQNVLSGRVDVGIVGVQACDETARLVLDPLAGHDLYFACRKGHPLTAVPVLTLSDLLRFPLVAPFFGGAAAGVAAGNDAAGLADANTGLFYPAIHVNSLHLARQIAAQSDALFPGTPAMLAADIAAGRLVQLDFHVPVMRVEYGLIHLADRSLSPAAAAFIAILREVEAEIALDYAIAPSSPTVTGLPDVARRSQRRVRHA